MKITIIVSAVLLMCMSAGCSDSDNGAAPAPIEIPDAPLGLEVLDEGFTTLTLSWDPSDDATNYRLYFSESVSGPFTPVYSGADTAAVDDNLIWAATYYYHVTAGNSAGESDPSAVISGATDTPGGFTVSGSPSGSVDYSFYYHAEYNGKSHYQTDPVGLNMWVPPAGDQAGLWVIHDQIEGMNLYYHQVVTDYPSRNLWQAVSNGARTTIILTPFAL